MQAIPYSACLNQTVEHFTLIRMTRTLPTTVHVLYNDALLTDNLGITT